MSEPSTRILLVDDDPDYPVLIRDLLSDIEDTRYAIDWAPTFDKASEKIRSAAYDLYLVDYRLGQRTGLDLLRTDLDHGRRGPVVILTGQATRELDLEAMQAGAVDFLVKGQFKASDLERCIRYALARHREAMAPPQTRTAPTLRRMISFIGAKGGVGTTTLTANVAAALARAGHRTLAVDLRPTFGTLATSICAVIRQDLGDVLRAPAKKIDEKLLRRSLVATTGGLEVLPSPQKAHQYRGISPEAARAVIDTAYQMSSYTVVDLPAAATVANREALWKSTFVGLVVERESTCLAAAERMLELLGIWGVRKAVGLVVVDRDASYSIGVSEVGPRLQREVFGLIPAAGHELRDAAARSTTVVGMSPDQEVSKAYTDLAERLASDVLRPLAL
ncbi:MAG: response regulator [Deltaproteobacteria bacterium]|nr:response regulator [Deltaproteobacteria bacterium]